jgi:hypothetical protein
MVSIMAKNAKSHVVSLETNNTAIALDTPMSIRDLGYKQAAVSGILESQARYAINKIVGFPEEIGKTDKAELFEGYQLKYNELHPAITYVVVDGNYLPIDELNPEFKDKEFETINIGIDYIMSFSQQAFGSLRTSDDPMKVKLHAVMVDRRKKFGTYCSNRLADLINKAKRLLKENQPRERGATKSFGDRVDALMSDLKDKCKTANARGDVTADSKALNSAILAFMIAWTNPTP